MKRLRFVWDERKNTLNKRKHGVSCEEGQTVFADEQACSYTILIIPMKKTGSYYSVSAQTAECSSYATAIGKEQT